MDAETLFSICNMAVLPGWALLVFLPRWQWTVRLIASVVLLGLLGLVYIALFATNFPTQGLDFGSLASVRSLFANDFVLLAGWVHYLAFDLFIGCWEVRDSQRIGMSHWFVIPCLALTFMLGPSGLVLYFIVRGAVKRRFLVGAAPALAA